MLKDLNNEHSNDLDFSFAKGKTIEAIVSFLDNKLPLFKDDLRQGLVSEDDISQECCMFLAREARNELFMFHFQHKYIGKKQSSDFSVISALRYASKDPIFVIEAKRLPTIGSGRSREYVEGKLGGIERFKRGAHGLFLQRSAMLGYIQKEKFSYWFKEINFWLQSLASNNQDATITWSGSETLSFKKTLQTVNKYQSVHLRNGQQPLTLDHYWIDLT